MVLLGSGGVAALPGSAASADVEPVEASLEQETSSAKMPAEAGAALLPPPERSPPTFESLILKVESELMPALGRLLNRTERMR